METTISRSLSNYGYYYGNNNGDDDNDVEEEEEEEGGTPIYDLSHHQWGTSETYESTFLLVFMLLFAFAIYVSFYMTHVIKCTMFPEAAVVLTIGIISSAIAVGLDPDGSVGKQLVQFSPTVFFVGLLPPIIFNSGYNVHKRHFFSNFGAISAFALIGTLTSTMFIGLVLYGFSKTGLVMADLELSECLTFGALISATDPVSTLAVFSELQVEPNLFYLVFGESVINDAVGVVLFNTFSKFVGYSHGMATVGIAIADFLLIFVGSFVIGYLVGCFAGLMSKHMKFHNNRLVEMSIYLLLMYLPYFVAEAVEMSGIVATLFAGITTRHYAHGNLSVESQDQAKFLFKMAAFITETAVFLDLGLSAFRLDYIKSYRPGLIFWALALCLIGRAIHVYPLSYGLNSIRKPVDGLIEPKHQHMMWFSGLRGAVAFACAQVFPNANGNREVFLITTMAIVLLTVFTMGCATVPVLKFLDIGIGIDEDEFNPPPPTSCTMAMLEFDSRHIMPRLTTHGVGGERIRDEYAVPEHRTNLMSDQEDSNGGGGGGRSHMTEDLMQSQQKRLLELKSTSQMKLGKNIGNVSGNSTTHSFSSVPNAIDTTNGSANSSCSSSEDSLDEAHHLMRSTRNTSRRPMTSSSPTNAKNSFDDSGINPDDMEIAVI